MFGSHASVKHEFWYTSLLLLLVLLGVPDRAVAENDRPSFGAGLCCPIIVLYLDGTVESGPAAMATPAWHRAEAHAAQLRALGVAVYGVMDFHWLGVPVPVGGMESSQRLQLSAERASQRLLEISGACGIVLLDLRMETTSAAAGAVER